MSGVWAVGGDPQALKVEAITPTEVAPVIDCRSFGCDAPSSCICAEATGVSTAEYHSQLEQGLLAGIWR